ncbi:hypothetical protein RI367_002302 [Sorochytrium milnesiophthora]
MSFSLTRCIVNALKVGPRSSWKQLMTLGEIKAGTLVGTDNLGNEYYENKDEITVRTRWVVPAKKNFDPSEIPAEWHMWIHKIDERAPSEANIAQRKWMTPHTDNASGREDAYKVFNTTEPKTESWQPKTAARG